MTTTRNANRSQRNNPYLLDGYAVSFHRSAAGVAWRWRTELVILAVLGAALLRLSRTLTLTGAAIALGRARAGGPGRARLAPVPDPPVLVHPGPAPHPPALLRSTPAHPLRAAPAGAVDPADQSRRTRPRPVPRRHLRRGLRGPHRRAARRLLRPRRAGHPQPQMVPAGDHRHHPPRHPRRQPIRPLTPPGAGTRPAATRTGRAEPAAQGGPPPGPHHRGPARNAH